MQDRFLRRRHVLASAAISALAAGTSSLDGQDDAARSTPGVCVYTEHFQSLPIPEVCRLFAEMGVDGLDLTVRPGGHIKPAEVKTQLPLAARAARDHGLKIMMLTTGITGPGRVAEETLAACQREGIDRIKLGYYRVGEFGSLARRLGEVREQLESVVELSAKYRVRPCVHVHSGPTIPSSGWMLLDLVRTMPPEKVGAYLDSYHMTITGGAGGWRQAIDLLRPWISLVALKNFQWHRGERDGIGQQRWRTDYCPLADGIAPIPEFVETVHEAGYRGFYTLHTEYRKPLKECLAMTRDDFIFLKKVFVGLDG